MYGCLACMHVCIPWVWLVSAEAKRGHWVPWEWSYIQMVGSCCVGSGN